MTHDNLTFTEESTGDKQVTLAAKGQITAANADKLKKKLEDIISEKNNCIIIDMSGISFLSSAGIRILLMFFKIMKSNNGNLFVKDPSSNVRNVLGMVALDEMLYR